jgi:cobalt-zinc-cadmium efflux system outer membrane protein
LALSQRVDLAALHVEVAMMDDAQATARRWRLLGTAEAGYVRERETDESKLRGPTLTLALPLFDQGQAAVARSEAHLIDARARRDRLALAIENEVAAGAARLELAREIAAQHRESWLPAASSAVNRRQERVNFMLEGVFTLLAARQEQYEAQAAWIGSVRDYWTERAALRAAVGGMLPGDDAALPPAIDVEEIRPAPDAHQHHGGGS